MSLPADAVHGCWYRDGDLWVVVVGGQPEQPVEIGTGETPEEAWSGRQPTPIQSCQRRQALEWARGAGWISRGELEDVDDEEVA